MKLKELLKEKRLVAVEKRIANLERLELIRADLIQLKNKDPSEEVEDTLDHEGTVLCCDLRARLEDIEEECLEEIPRLFRRHDEAIDNLKSSLNEGNKKKY